MVNKRRAADRLQAVEPSRNNAPNCSTDGRRTRRAIRYDGHFRPPGLTVQLHLSTVRAPAFRTSTIPLRSIRRHPSRLARSLGGALSPDPVERWDRIRLLGHTRSPEDHPRRVSHGKV